MRFLLAAFSMLLDKMFFKNQMIWLHMLGGGLLTKLIDPDLTGWSLVLSVFALSVLYEVGEYLFDDVRNVYGSTGAFLLDATGDILGAVMISAMIAL